MGRVKARARGKHEPGRMNGLESKYAQQLYTRKVVGEIADYRFEALKLRLADLTFYTPDFMVINASREIELHEVKGYWEDDARVKIKVAAEMFPEFHFVGIQWSKREGWQFEQF